MKKVVTVCPYCASGCKIHLVVDNGQNRPGGSGRRVKPIRARCA
ncbi:hypothetical protein [Enterobacter hormaechei]